MKLCLCYLQTQPLIKRTDYSVAADCLQVHTHTTVAVSLSLSLSILL